MLMTSQHVFFRRLPTTSLSSFAEGIKKKLNAWCEGHWKARSKGEQSRLDAWTAPGS